MREVVEQLAQLEAAHDSLKAEAALLRRHPGANQQGALGGGSSAAAGDIVSRSARGLLSDAMPEGLEVSVGLIRIMTFVLCDWRWRRTPHAAAFATLRWTAKLSARRSHDTQHQRE